MEILFDSNIIAAAPALQVIYIEADVESLPTSDALWAEVEAACNDVAERYSMELIRHRPAIDATRNVYKACGKDPNRYRPSAEALCRRAVKGLELYRSLALIDLINLVSLVSGHSIGAFDADCFVGPTLALGVGAEGEPYDAIGRGELNIAGLPVYRDAVGGVGTPTSDNERTKLSENTRRLAVTVNIYGPGDISNEDVEQLVVRLIEQYANAKNIQIEHYSTAQ